MILVQFQTIFSLLIFPSSLASSILVQYNPTTGYASCLKPTSNRLLVVMQPLLRKEDPYLASPVETETPGESPPYRKNIIKTQTLLLLLGI